MTDTPTPTPTLDGLREELKPCAFCQNAPILTRTGNDASVYCYHCGARMKRRGDPGSDSAVKSVVEAWNTRASALAPEGAAAWLIERGGEWWGPMFSRWDWEQALAPLPLWTSDANAAVRFHRKEDAEAFMRWEGLAGGAKATEHIWLDGHSPAIPQPDDADWHVVSEAVSDAIGNADGHVSADALEAEFKRSGLIVAHAAAQPATPPPEVRGLVERAEIERNIEAIKADLLADLDTFYLYCARHGLPASEAIGPGHRLSADINRMAHEWKNSITALTAQEKSK